MAGVKDRQIEVLLTGGNSRSGLAVARSLARQGISFAVATEEPNCMTSHSRYVRNTLPFPSPTKDREAYVERTVEVIRKYGIQLVMPVAESTVILFDEYRQAIEEQAQLAVADSQTLRKVLDKRLNLEIARRVGVPCPKQYQLESRDQVPELIKTLGFPIVLKPRGSRLDFRIPGRFPFKYLIASNRQDLDLYLQRYCSEEISPLFQERVRGRVHNLCIFAVRGEVAAIHEYHSLRRHCGVGVLRRIVEPTPEAVEWAKRLLKEIHWEGVAHIGFFINPETHQMWYMETNGRFWSSVEGSVHAGWDFPYWQYNYFLHGKSPQPGPLQIGSRTCWHRGDLAALLDYFMDGPPPADETSPGRLWATLEYLSGFSPAIHSDVFRWSDPWPAIIDHRQLFRELRKARIERGTHPA